MPRGVNIYQVTVNGVKRDWVFDDIKYGDIVRMALGFSPRPGEHLMSITYKHGKDGAHGILIVGEKIQTVNGLVFNAYETGNA